MSSIDDNLTVDSWLAAIEQPALIIDTDGVIVQLNTALQKLVRTSHSFIQPGSPLTSFLPDIASFLPDSLVAFDTISYLACPHLAVDVRVCGLPILRESGGAGGWCLVFQTTGRREEYDGRRLRILLASMDDLVYVIALDGTITEYHQQSVNELVSLNSVAIGRHYADYFSQDVAEALREAITRARETGETQRYDQELNTSGHTAWYSVNVKMLHDNDGSPTGYLYAARNITERKRFENSEREQRIFAEALQDVAIALNSTLDLDRIWDRILVNLDRVVPADSTAILLVEGDVARVVGQQDFSRHACSDNVRGNSIDINSVERLQHMVRTKEPFLVSYTDPRTTDTDADGEDAGDGKYTREFADECGPWVRSYLGAPIVLDNAVIGFIRLESATANRFTETDTHRLRAFCNHASTAIRNARHFAQAQELAAYEERQRLARDLHDAVSQMLFSAKIIAEMLPRLRKRDPDSIWDYLLELQRLIQGAMGEMRMLLMELRPSILNDVELHVLLGYLVDATSARTSAKIVVSASKECALPHDVQVAFYRIAQESLSNAVKYAHADNILISIEKRNDHVVMLVQDDGTGFTDSQVRPENLGLSIMHERASEAGADIRIDSSSESGTIVEVQWPASDQRGPAIGFANG